MASTALDAQQASGQAPHLKFNDAVRCAEQSTFDADKLSPHPLSDGPKKRADQFHHHQSSLFVRLI